MKLLFVWNFYAADANPNGNAANLPEAGEVSEIMDNFDIPTKTRGGGGNRGSQYFTPAIQNRIEELLTKGKKGNAILIGFIPNDAVKNPAKNQRDRTNYRIKDWADGQVTLRKAELNEKMAGLDPVKDAEAIQQLQDQIKAVTMPKFTVAVVDKGIAVRRDS